MVANNVSSRFQENAFSDVLLDFSVSAQNSSTENIFTKAFCQALAEINDESPTFPMGQVFEKGVLKEISFLTSRSYTDVVARCFPLQKTQPEQLIAGEISSTQGSENSEIQHAGALINVSRFELAKTKIAKVRQRKLSPIQSYETQILRFIISNRFEGGLNSNDIFANLRTIVKSQSIPATKVVEAAALAVVWHLKTGEIRNDLAEWFTATAKTLLDRDPGVSPEARSSWYRAYAMVPAATKDISATRDAMESAKRFAYEAIQARGPAYAANYLKTYYESSIKEHLYVSGDIDQALDAACKLVELDPEWSESWAELGEVYEKRGEIEAAEKAYARAMSLGAPYYLVHVYQHACCLLQIDQVEEGLASMVDLSELDPTNRSAVVVGFKYAQKHNSRHKDFFANKLRAITPDLNVVQRKFLEEDITH